MSLPGLSIQSDTSEEWFSFTTKLKSGPADSVAIRFDPSLGQLDLNLLDQSGKPIASSATVGGSEVISLSGMAANTYYVEVSGAANPDYTLTVTGPGTTVIDNVIAQENGGSNNSFATAFDLGTPSGVQSIGPLSFLTPGGNEWFKFMIPSGVTPDSSDFVGILLDNTLGDLDVQLYNASMTLEGQAETSNDFDHISLAGLTGGVYYYVEVAGHTTSTTNPEYDLILQTPNTTAPVNTFGPNPINDITTAADLQTIDGVQTFNGLAIGTTPDSQNWFSFNLVSGLTGREGQSVSISYDHTQGNLTLTLYDQNATLLGSSKPRPATSSSFRSPA